MTELKTLGGVVCDAFVQAILCFLVASVFAFADIVLIVLCREHRFGIQMFPEFAQIRKLLLNFTAKLVGVACSSLLCD